MTKPTVLFISSYEQHGGAEEVLINLMDSASQNGFRPILVVPRYGWITEQCKIRNFEFKILQTLPRPFSYSKWVHLRSWLFNALIIAKLAKKNKAVLVHSNGARAAFHGGLAARLAGIPSIAHIHDVIKLPYESRLFARILRYLVDETICVSKFVEDEVIRNDYLLIGKTQIIYNGTQQEIYNFDISIDYRQEWQINSKEILIGTISTMNWFKGQDLLIHSFNELSQIHKNIRLVIVGGAQGVPEQVFYEEKLKQMVKEMTLENRVIFTGWSEDIVNKLHAFDIFSFTPSQPEALGLVLIHACGVGKPIISSNIGGIPEIIIDQKTGILIEPSNVDELTGALDLLITNPHMRKFFTEKSNEQYHQNFTIEQMTDQLNAIYEKIIS